MRRLVTLAGTVAALAVGAYAATLVITDPSVVGMLVWFAGALVLHDLVLFPLYAAGDRLPVALPRTPVPLVNHVRIPVLGAGLTFLLYLPGIIRQGEPVHLGATGLDQSPYLTRWLLLVAAMVAVSALVYAVRLVLTTRSAAGGSPAVPVPPGR
jgi:hypothetical protein